MLYVINVVVIAAILMELYAYMVIKEKLKRLLPCLDGCV